MLKFTRFADCQPGDLIRLFHKGETRWAIIAAWRDSAVRMLAILSGKDAPCFVNTVVDGLIKPEFGTHQVLVYSNYGITTDHAATCDIGEGPNFEAKGSLILADSAMFLRLDLSAGGFGFLNLDTYEFLQTPPAPPLAAFKKWTLSCELTYGVQTVLIEYPAEPAVG
jgi:hypothetical protein